MRSTIRVSDGRVFRPAWVLSVAILAVMAPRALGFAGGVDLSRWIEQRSRISGTELVFRVPPGDSPAMPGRPLVRQVDLERDLDRKTGGIGVFAHAWDFRGWFWQGVLGDLDVTVAVRSRPSDYQKDLTALENLQALIDRKLKEFHEPRNEEGIRKGQSEFNVTVPSSYKRVTIHDTEWLVYSLGGWLDRTDYATPLTPAHYLEVGFDFIDNSKRLGYKTTWRRDAQVLADQIAATLELRRVK